MRPDATMDDMLHSSGPAEQDGLDARPCARAGCSKNGNYRAPVGRQAANVYYWFCLDHVRTYNRSYNYFDGMNDEEVIRFQKASVTGFRPTWIMGGRRSGFRADGFFHDPFDLFRRHTDGAPEAGNGGKNTARPERSVRLRPTQRTALLVLGMDAESGEPVTLARIKARFKALVKRHHPDANGGDRAEEKRLIRIIQAYDYLKSSGIC